MGAPCPIVPVMLNEGNYGWWKIWMKNYLLGEELWDIVEGTEPKPDEATQVAEFRTWKRKNGKALHAIQVSCAGEVFCTVSEIDSAKVAWDQLAFMDRKPFFPDNPIGVPESSSLLTQGRINEDNTWRLLLHKSVVKGDWERTKSLINSHQEALKARLPMGETILHAAIIHNHVHLVLELVKLMQVEDLELTLPYRTGATALHLAALGGIVKIAQVLVEKKDTLLCLRDQKGYLPILRASFCGNKAMVRYLYSVTPNELMNPSISKDGVNLLINAIVAEDYDFALEIHRDHPQCTLARNDNGITALQALAERPFAFPSGNQLKLWQRWIYNCWFL